MQNTPEYKRLVSFLVRRADAVNQLGQELRNRAISQLFDLGIAAYPGVGMLLGTLKHFTAGSILVADLAELAELPEMVTDFMKLALAPRYRAYWSMYERGYIDRSDLLAFTGCWSMETFYERAGFPASIQERIKQYEDNQMSGDQLAQSMGVNGMRGVSSVLGSGWSACAGFSREIKAATGESVSVAELRQLTGNTASALMNMDNNDGHALYEHYKALKSAHAGDLDLAQLDKDVSNAVADSSRKTAPLSEEGSRAGELIVVPHTVALRGRRQAVELDPTPQTLSKIAVASVMYEGAPEGIADTAVSEGYGSEAYRISAGSGLPREQRSPWSEVIRKVRAV